MTWQTLDLSVDDGGIAYLALNLPETRNALSAAMIAELTEVAETLGANPSVRAVILSGRGKVFCAGGDLNWMKAQIEADRETRMAEAKKLAMMLKSLNEMPKPLIAAIQGGAYGGGVGLAAVADVAVAAEDAKLGLTETRLGLIPATIGPYVIARLGEGMARRVFMSSRRFDAAEARDIGLVAKVVAPDALHMAALAEARPYLSVAPGAVGRAKALARELGPQIDEATIARTIEHLADAWETEEAAKGIEAFLTRTPPPWA